MDSEREEKPFLELLGQLNNAVSRTADAVKENDKVTVKPQYTVLQPGLLTPGRKYYWHVRAMSDKGAWGPWSATWSFTPRGPACPLDLAIDDAPADVHEVPVLHARGAGRLAIEAREAAVQVHLRSARGFNTFEHLLH